MHLIDLSDLRNILEQYSGDMKVVILDDDGNEYDFNGVKILKGKYSEPVLAIKFE